MTQKELIDAFRALTAAVGPLLQSHGMGATPVTQDLVNMTAKAQQWRDLRAAYAQAVALLEPKP